MSPNWLSGVSSGLELLPTVLLLRKTAYLEKHIEILASSLDKVSSTVRDLALLLEAQSTIIKSRKNLEAT